MMGRPVGKREVTAQQIIDIARLSEEGLNRSEISDEVGLAKRTVWEYQKQLLFL